MHPNLCHSRLRVVSFALKWSIDQFSVRCTGNDTKNSHPFISAQFSPSHQDQPKFVVQLYPRGRNDEFQEYVSVFVFLKSCDQAQLNAMCSISILDANGDKCKTWGKWLGLMDSWELSMSFMLIEFSYFTESEHEFALGGQGWGKVSSENCQSFFYNPFAFYSSLNISPMLICSILQTDCCKAISSPFIVRYFWFSHFWIIVY